MTLLAPTFRPDFLTRAAASFPAFRQSEPVLYGTGVALLIAMAPTYVASLVDGRTFQGVDVWSKPLKFEFALAVYVLTLVWFARWLPSGLKEMRWYRFYVGSVVIAIAAEMIWIGAAAMLGTSSHFNTSPLGQVVYGFMGAAAVLLTSLSAVFAYQIARNSRSGLPPAVSTALVLGLAMVLPLTLMTAGTLSSMGSHFVGGSGSDTGGFPLMGWSRDGGDLRVAHFFATHAMHFIPVLGLLSAALFGPADRRPVVVMAAAFTAFVLWTFVEALSGRPFLAFVG